MPAVVDTIESKGWDLDYYMTCVYERHRTEAELEKLLGQAPIPVGEVYLPKDPPRMFKTIRQTKRPCLAFKILAAGRLSERKEWVEQAFRETFAAIKPTDARDRRNLRPVQRPARRERRIRAPLWSLRAALAMPVEGIGWQCGAAAGPRHAIRQSDGIQRAGIPLGARCRQEPSGQSGHGRGGHSATLRRTRCFPAWNRECGPLGANGSIQATLGVPLPVNRGGPGSQESGEPNLPGAVRPFFATIDTRVRQRRE